MADTKISALPAASTPLAGTEVLPIVQSGVTDKVAVNDLTAGRAVSTGTVAVTDSTVPANGMYLSAANTLSWATNTTLRLSLSTTALTSTLAVSAPSLTLTTTPLAGGSGGTGLSTFTAANRIPYAASTTALTTSAGLTFDGTNLATTGSATAASFIPSGSSVPTNGMYLSAANTLAWSTNSTVRLRMDASGNIGFGVAPSATANFYSTKNVTGGTSAYVSATDCTVQSDVTVFAYGHYSRLNTVAAAFTLSKAAEFWADASGIGAGSSITFKYGFGANALVSATNNYQFFAENAAAVTSGKTTYDFFSNSNIATGGGTTWGFFANGTAPNAFTGKSRFGAATAPVNTVDITGSLGRGAPVTKTGDFTLAATENWVIVNQAGTTTVTLPAASSWTGREVMFKTIQNQTLVSASSNVVPLAGGAAGTAILAATAGKWATCVSDGTNWILMAGN